MIDTLDTLKIVVEFCYIGGAMTPLLAARLQPWPNKNRHWLGTEVSWADMLSDILGSPSMVGFSGMI